MWREKKGGNDRMVKYVADYKYIESEEIKLFTVILLPDSVGKFPSVLVRSPYVDKYENADECDVALEYLNENKEWIKRGYAVIIQHCRGRGKSEGDCIPYINERKDSLLLQEWVRKQPFYNGEILLKGKSYLSSVNYLSSPFADDIKGAIFGVQDSERYNICYRNGFFKKALHGYWYVQMYKAKSHMKKNYTTKSFDMLPMKDFTKTVFGECAEDFDLMLSSPNPKDEFWNTFLGGVQTRNATKDANFPILLTTGFYDIYTGGIFDMWKSMSKKTQAISALVVSPYDHVDWCDVENSIVFENGKTEERFGVNYEIEWFDFILGRSTKAPFETGKVTYYRLFDNKWATDSFTPAKETIKIKLGNDEVSYVYNPYDAPGFKGGLSRAFGGAVYQDKPNSRHDIISTYTMPFDENVFVKGKITAALNVKSDCEDTCFYIRISIEKEQGDYGLRDDITSLCYQLGEYSVGSAVLLKFDCDEHAFMIKKGERLRIDISSADNEHYIRHTNNKGLYSEQTNAKIAHNTVYLQDSYLVLPVEA